MGGKTATSQQNVTVPPAVLAQYQSVVGRANQTAQRPFQTYGGQFVAPINAQQQFGIEGTNTYANAAQPYYGAATGVLGATQGGVNPINAAATGLAGKSAEQVNAQQIGPQQIAQFENPYLGQVLGSTAALLNQNNQQQQQGALGTAISSGAFGGDRTGIAAANLEQQQNLANANIYSGIASNAFNTALGAAQQQQGVNLSAAQANRAALANAGAELAGIGQTAYGEGANTASELAGLGAGAQGAGLQGAQAQIGAGTLEQQTQQAQDTALYNQFLQQQSFPYQVGSWLAGISEGTGALSGSTTTTQQPGGFFSDVRLKHSIKKIGKLFDGQEVYSYKMHGDPRTHIGLIAQKVEKKHPEAIGLARGYKTVDYGTATQEAANRRHFYQGGVIPMRRAFQDGGYSGPYGDLSSILATQENMYQPNQTRNRNIPAQSQQQYQLAVASGSPQPQPSGASKVNQSIGLGRQGYQIYNHFASPTTPMNNSANIYPGMTTTPSGAINQGGYMVPDPGAGGLGGAVDAAPAAPVSAPTAGLAGADAAASAAPAAASVAAPAAADAAAGAAVDAGATEAAALAAEYAVGDAAVAAAAAAKRGGKIKRPGLAGGGDPYEMTPTGDPYSMSAGQMDIPDSAAPAKLQTAGPLVKRPTGLETAMSMGDPNDISSIAGSLFSNQALGSARGGRRGYQDGGDPTDVLPEIEVDAERPEAELQGPPAGLAGAHVAPAASTKKSFLGSLGDWWGAHKTDVIPALEGLAAMGTAPTRSLGVALAAGLGAGAQAYLPTQQEAANVQRMGYLLNAIRQPQSIPSEGTPTAQPGFSGVGIDPSNIASEAQKRFAFKDIWTPQETTNLSQQQHLQQLGLPNTLPSVNALHTARMQNQQTAQQQGALGTYQAVYQVATAPPGAALEKVMAIDPLAAKQIQQRAKGDINAADGMARVWAGEVGNQAYQYTGRKPVTDTDGISRDPFSQRPILGQVPIGMSAKDEADYRMKLYGTTEETGAAARPTTAALMGANAPNPNTSLRPQVPGTAPAPSVTPSLATGNSAPRHTLLGPPPSGNPNVVGGAAIDPQYRLPAQPTIHDPQTSETAETWKTTIAKRAELLDDAKAMTSSSAQALVYVQAAQALMKTNGVPTGLSAPAKVAISRVAQALGITPGSSATANQELAKYLANIAVQNFKQNFGARPAAKEFDIQMGELNPKADMTPDAINGLLDFNSRNLNYLLQTGHRAAEYSAKNGDPQQFYDWNNAHFPQSVSVNGPTQPGHRGQVITTKEQYDALPHKATYIWNGRTGTKL